MAVRNSLPSFRILLGNLQLALTSAVTHIGFLDNVGIQTDLEGGDAAGTLEAQVSANFKRDLQGNVTDPGTWVTLLSQDVAAGEPVTTYMDLSWLSAPWIRLIWTPSTLLTQDIATIADVGGSLNSTYFFISSLTVDYVVWISVDSGGVAPDLGDGYTYVEVDISADDSADDVATAVAAALDALTGIFTASAATIHATVANVVAGASTAAVDGNTGFTISVATEDMLTSVITAKGI